MSETSSHRLTFRRLVYGANWKRTLVRAFITGVILIFVFKFAFTPVRVSGLSMEPTYHDHRINLVNRLSYKSSSPRRGDVVGVWPRVGSRRIMLMKRIVGLPGESVGFRDGRVTVNGRSMDEPYVKFPSDWNVAPVTCGPNEYFVVGDNRSMEFELHTLGRVTREQIVGKMML